MRRSWWFRPFTVLFTLWFPLVLGEPSLLQPCPTHGAVAKAAAPHHHGAATEAPAGSGHEHAPAPAPGHQHHQCTCIGCCVGSVAAILSPTGPTIAFADATYEVANRLPTVESLARPGPDYARPFTTGPPRA